MLYAEKPPSAKILKTQRQGNCLLLYSDYGTHRLSPKNAYNIHVSFTREDDFSDSPRLGIINTDDFKDWTFESDEREILLKTDEITLKINTDTASYSWFDKNGKLLLSETEKDSRSLEKFDVYKTVGAKTEKVRTADGEKAVVTDSQKKRRDIAGTQD